jgi:hypothetical protein
VVNPAFAEVGNCEVGFSRLRTAQPGSWSVLASRSSASSWLSSQASNSVNIVLPSSPVTRDAAQQKADELRAQTGKAASGAQQWWSDVQQTWSGHVARLRGAPAQ